MKSGSSMPQSQGLSNNAYPEPNQSSSSYLQSVLQDPFHHCPSKPESS